MAQPSSSVILVGSTGLVGSHLATTLLSSTPFPAVYAFTRRDPSSPSSSSNKNFHPIVLPDSSTWAQYIPNTFSSSNSSSSPPPPALALLTALGTSRARAGGLAQQRAIDYDLNLSLCRAAAEQKVPICIVISSNGASASSRLPYLKLKGDLDEAVATLAFRDVVIIRPGLLLGKREDRRPGTEAIAGLAGLLGKTLGHRATDFWAQDASMVASAAVNAMNILSGSEQKDTSATTAEQNNTGTSAAETDALSKKLGLKPKPAKADTEDRTAARTWILEQADIVRLGRSAPTPATE